MNLGIVRIYVVPGRPQIHVQFQKGWIRFRMTRSLKFGKYGTTGGIVSMHWDQLSMQVTR